MEDHKHIHSETHTHEHKHEHEHDHVHAHHHSEEHKKKILNRLSKAIGHLESVKRMVEDDRDCADVLMQLAAVNAALKNTGKVIINEHIDHCILHALEDGDSHAIDEFKSAVDKFL